MSFALQSCHICIFIDHEIDDHKFLVELACSTTLIPAYHPALLSKILGTKSGNGTPVVVFVVCGGFKIGLETAAEYRQSVEEARKLGDTWTIEYDDGELLSFNNRLDR